jgi:cell division septation protein DedD
MRSTMEQGSVRNLEQIQESDGERTPRGVTILLVALGGACIVFAGLAIGGRKSAPTTVKVDPLGELVSAQAKAGSGSAPAPKATDLSTRDVTFPGILSDEGSPTTALAAVKGGTVAVTPKAPATGTPQAGVLAAPADPPAAIVLNVRGTDPSSASPAGDRLPVVPLPAQNMLGASPVVTRPRDSLTRAASDAVESAGAGATAAPAGREGGYQLQVSSFRTQNEADTFSGQLRARGHKAYVVEAHVPGRGTWYRVRIGPFTSQHAAASYRSGFEGREHVVPFIVPPSK